MDDSGGGEKNGEGEWMEGDPNVEKDDVGNFDIWSAFGPGTGFGSGGGGEEKPDRNNVVDENTIEEIGSEGEGVGEEEKGGGAVTCTVIDGPGNAITPMQQVARGAVNRSDMVLDHSTIEDRSL